MARSGLLRAFVAEEFIKNGGLPIATQRSFRVHFALGQMTPFLIKKIYTPTVVGPQHSQSSPTRSEDCIHIRVMMTQELSDT
ncbi:hypothetical protein J6590_032088 [Homalodisca vitripennis]|nr:hypothetical protein J6590_032088 [Homalodisca vitripennis]